jgi:hypothetical protein
MSRSTFVVPLLLVPLGLACGPEPEPQPACVNDGALAISFGMDTDEFTPLGEGGVVVIDENEDGQLVANLRVRVDGLSESDPVQTLSAFLYAEPGEPVGDPQLGDEGQQCIAEGAARECNSIDLRCVGDPGAGERCLHLLGNSALAEAAFTCDEADEAMHQRGLTLRMLSGTPVEELEGAAAELRFFLETQPDQFEEVVLQTELDVASIP